MSSISFPGSDILFSPAPSLTPAGFGPLGLHNYGSPSSAAASPASAPARSTTVNPYQQAYDSLELSVNSYLQNSIVNPPATLPEFAAGGTASSYASLNTLLAQLKNGLSQGFFSGIGTNIDASA